MEEIMEKIELMNALSEQDMIIKNIEKLNSQANTEIWAEIRGRIWSEV